MTRRAAVILAAGQGTRMKSPTPKVLHKVAGRAMLDLAIDAAQELGCDRIVVVVGAHSPEVGEHVKKRLGEAAIAVQDPPLGTGHAVLAARDALASFSGHVVVTYADCPLLTAAAIEPLFDLHDTGADVAVLGFEAADPGAYGRLILGEDGDLRRIVEAKDATDEQRAVIACNSGVMAADAALLFDLLDQVGERQRQGRILPHRRGRPGGGRRALGPGHLRAGRGGDGRQFAGRARDGRSGFPGPPPPPAAGRRRHHDRAGHRASGPRHRDRRRRHRRALRGVRSQGPHRGRRRDPRLQPYRAGGGAPPAPSSAPTPACAPAPTSGPAPTSATSSRSRTSRSARGPSSTT